jgi:uncharacterized membrane protein HdeD (DUF308 family)
MSVPSEYRLMSSWRKISLVGGVLSIMLGLVLAAWPGKTMLVLTALVGVWLLLLGCSRLGDAVTGRANGPPSRAGRGFLALSGAIYLLAGILVLTNLNGSVRFVTVLLGVIWVCAGLSEALSGLSHAGGPWVRRGPILAGLINIALGIIVLAWPEISVTVLTWIASLWLILLGVLQLYFSVRARRAERELSGRPS